MYAVTREDGAALALKILHNEHAGNLELVLRFLNEEHAATRVCHPAVVRIEEAGLFSGRPYLIMERLTGTLAQCVLHMSLADRIAVTAQVAQGAAALAKAGIVHRDLKPANVMFAPGSELRAKIIDLGLAKLGDDGGRLPVSTASTEVLGTAEYRAPELWLSAKDVDERADVYSLGVMLYELLTDRLPFNAERESELMELHLYAPLPALPTLPPALRSLVERMLAKARGRRPAMAEVAAALHEIAVDR